MAGSNEFSIIVDEDKSGLRIDALIASQLPDCSRTLVADLIRKGIIRVGDQVKKPGYRLHMGDIISGHIPYPEPVSFKPEPIELHILFEDSDIIVINKKPGIVVHPAPGHNTGTLVNGLLYHCPDLQGIGGYLRPGIVHRLDKDTSGVLVVAKNNYAMSNLASQFKARTIKKTYLALVHGEIEKNSGEISLPIGRHPTNRKKMSTISKHGKPAKTLWTVQQRFSKVSFLNIDLKTGRTHQIRVHFEAIGHPLVGDTVYCKKSKKHIEPVYSILKTVSRQMLHAWKICLNHPVNGKSMEFEASLPQDMQQLINSLIS